MASSNPDLTKTPKRRSSTSRKVRLVAKIGGASDPDAEVSGEVSWISVNKPGGEVSESVTLSFRDQSASRKEAYELDYCYDQNEDNGQIFSREVKPLIPGILEGCNATVIALGARGSGKTSLIQGSSEKPGLATLAIDEIISMAEKNGCSITISSYEVYQDHIYDILAPSRPEVLVLGDTQGNIRLKGLSQVPVKSISEFSKLYGSGYASRKPAPKGPVELSRRCHKGLIVYVSSQRENSDSLQFSKLNIIDLAGYEDTRRKSTDCINHVESSKINKSIYAMINVVNAVSSSGNHVPYRENKLTHLLQDSLGGMSRVLMITCLKPSFCQDSIYMVSLVAHSSQNTNQAVTGSTKKSKGLTRSEVHSSRSSQNTNQAVTGSTKKSKGLTRSEVHSSHKGHVSMTASAIAKKQTISRKPLSEKKVNGTLSSKKANGSVSFALKGRKLLDEKSRLTKSMKATAMSDIVSTIETSVPEKEDEGPEQLKSENPSSDALDPIEPTSIVQKDELLSDDPKHSEHSLNEEKEYLLVDDPKHEEDDSIAEKDVSMNCDGPTEEGNPSDDNSSGDALALVEEVQDMEKENNNFPDNEDASPPISARLQELALKMKSLCSTTPLCMKMPEEKDTSSNNFLCTDIMESNAPVASQDIRPNDSWELANVNNIMEPKTPVAGQDIKHNDRWEVANVNSPWEALSVRSAGVKQSLVQEYLSFLNTASKEDLKRLKGIGEKRATYILNCREETPEPFKSLDDLQDIGLSVKQIKNLMKKAGGGLFD
ncbi:PREDICTED: kinesin-like protein KIF22 [Fragaria vesca subsp. vesca]|uniref:kinesin-like protein KIF22 n=1 Tax=Fragaria vesca subsp. vesca TaxID=101020 RepID=UPI0002C34424|nr:PREDICTED: kinesin-like protein KIF22 [Fragaria vesca subsp. vesca]